jgi:hypothetical protein
VDDPREGVLQVGEGVKVPTKDDHILEGDGDMGHVGPHKAVKGSAAQQGMREGRKLGLTVLGPESDTLARHVAWEDQAY